MTTPLQLTEPSRFSRLATWLFRYFFKLLYHQFAWAYDLVAWTVSLGRWNYWIRASMPYIHGPLVLELGHGPGHLQVTLSATGFTAIGLDQSPHMSHLARRRLLRKSISPKLIQGQSQFLPFASNTLPQLIVTFPSEYISDQRTLSEVYRVLTPGGSVVILLFAWITGHNTLDRIAAWLFRITGEAPTWEDRFLMPARAMGFVTHSEFIDHPSSKLLFLHLQKPS